MAVREEKSVTGERQDVILVRLGLLLHQSPGDVQLRCDALGDRRVLREVNLGLEVVELVGLRVDYCCDCLV